MDKYVGLDVSMEETSVCILDGVGKVVYEGKAPSQPDALAKLLSSKARDAIRIVFETGALASWLWHPQGEELAGHLSRRTTRTSSAIDAGQQDGSQ